jgi:sulfur carrier protein ThiS
MPGRGIRVSFQGLPAEAEARFARVEPALEEGATVADLLARLAAQAEGEALRILDPGRKNLRPEFLLTLNGRFLEKSRFPSAVLKDGDVVEVFPVPSGG